MYRKLLTDSAPLVVRAVALTRLPVVRGLLDDVVRLIGDVAELLTGTSRH